MQAGLHTIHLLLHEASWCAWSPELANMLHIWRTDFRDLYDTSAAAGLEEAKRVLKKRGRWRSDIAFIYARTSLDSSLEASARLADVGGRDIESAFAGWAEPAR